MRFPVDVAVVLCMALGLSGPTPGRSRQDLYFGFTRLDPVSESVTPNAWLIVTDGRISKAGSGRPPAGSYDARHDLSGRFALPGFVDAHAHITAGPHALTMVDGKPLVTIESVDSITRFSARMALAFGVTSVRDPGGHPVANARYDSRVRSGDWVGPDAVHAGAVIQPAPFGGNAFAHPKADAEWDTD
jgi:imidazolonepropionase-like amidohydrolase